MALFYSTIIALSLVFFPSPNQCRLGGHCWSQHGMCVAVGASQALVWCFVRFKIFLEGSDLISLPVRSDHVLLSCTMLGLHRLS